MRTHTSVLPILLSLLLLTACDSDSAKASDPDQTKKSDLDQAQHIEQFQPETTTQALGAEGDIGDDTPLEWPTERMGNIPDPGCDLISFESEGKGQDEICTVEFATMNEKAAENYAADLEALGYLPETNTSDGEWIMFKGFDDSGSGVVFNYTVIYENGTISYGKKDALSGC